MLLKRFKPAPNFRSAPAGPLHTHHHHATLRLHEDHVAGREQHVRPQPPSSHLTRAPEGWGRGRPGASLSGSADSASAWL